MRIDKRDGCIAPLDRGPERVDNEPRRPESAAPRGSSVKKSDTTGGSPHGVGSQRDPMRSASRSSPKIPGNSAYCIEISQFVEARRRGDVRPHRVAASVRLRHAARSPRSMNSPSHPP